MVTHSTRGFIHPWSILIDDRFLADGHQFTVLCLIACTQSRLSLIRSPEHMKGICSNKNITSGAGRSLDRRSLPLLLLLGPRSVLPTASDAAADSLRFSSAQDGRDWLSTLDTHKLEDRIHLLGLKRRTGPLLWFHFRKSTSSHPPGLLALEIAADHLCWFQVLKREIAFFGGRLKLAPCSADTAWPLFHGKAF